MADFFSDNDNQDRLMIASAAWLGTPFRPHTKVRQGGVDCVNLISGIMEESGVPHDFHPPDYALDWARHGDRSQLLDYLRAEPLLRELEAGETDLPGDILTFQIGQIEHHAGISLGGTSFLHTTQSLGTVEDSLSGRWRQRLGARFRVATQLSTP